MSNIDCLFPRITSVITDEIISSVTEIIDASCLKLMNVEAHFLPSGSKPIPPHQDNFYHCLKDGKGLKVLVPLDSLNPFNGGLCFADCTSRIGLLCHEPSSVENFSSYIPLRSIEQNITSFACYNYFLGDCSYHLLNSIHFSYGNNSEHDVCFVVFRYQDSNAQIDKSQELIYQECYNKHLNNLSCLQQE